MAKISRFGGPSYEGHEGVVYDALDRPSEIDPDHQGRFPLVGEPTEKADKDEEAYSGDVRRKEDGQEKEGGEDESAGTSSSTSNESAEKTQNDSETSPRKPVRVTESRSK